MKYHFKNIADGQIAEGYVSLDITGHEAEVDPADAEAILLAEKHGGELVTQQGKPPANPEAYKARLVKPDSKGEPNE